MAVVDHELKVYGIESLRIADGSVMPRVTTGNTMAPCVIIGERAAEVLLAHHKLEKSELSPRTFSTFPREFSSLRRQEAANGPPATEPLTMPAHDRVRLDEDQGLAPVAPGVGEQDPEEPAAGAELRALDGALQRGQLLPKRHVLKGNASVTAGRSTRLFGGRRRLS